VDIVGQALNGLVYGALLFLLSVGLTLIFGMLDVVNLAHGSFYMLGAYAGIAALALTGNFWIAAITAPLVVGLVGALVERGLLRRLYRRSPLDQVLLTFGLIYLFEDLVKWGWGGRIRSISPPEIFAGRIFRLFELGGPFVFVFGEDERAVLVRDVDAFDFVFFELEDRAIAPIFHFAIVEEARVAFDRVDAVFARDARHLAA